MALFPDAFVTLFGMLLLIHELAHVCSAWETIRFFTRQFKWSRSRESYTKTSLAFSVLKMHRRLLEAAGRSYLVRLCLVKCDNGCDITLDLNWRNWVALRNGLDLPMIDDLMTRRDGFSDNTRATKTT